MPDEMGDAGVFYELELECCSCKACTFMLIGAPHFTDGRTMEPKAFADMLTGQIMAFECSECADEGTKVLAVRHRRMADVPEDTQQPAQLH